MAAVMEFTHTATLLHDDVIDGADIRRGQTAANRVWNSAISVLTGDFLLSLSINMVLQIRNDRVLDILSSTARKMSEGEIFQQSKTGDINISEEDYMKIITAKTALLFSASCKIGAVLGSVPEEKIKQMEDFGINLGQAFQLVDDFLDYVSTESDLGKAIGKDLGESKITLPLIYTLKKCDGKEKEFIEKVIEAKDLSDSNLESIIKIINRYGGIDYTRNMAQEMIDKSLRCLDGFDPESPDRKMLTTLAQFIVSRDR
jgi:octaprenyl-diphosphate synthase